MDDLIREAIADAKTLQKTALASAKITLIEAFTPKLKAMLSQTMQNEVEEDEEEDEFGGGDEFSGDDEVAGAPSDDGGAPSDDGGIDLAVEPETGEFEDEEDFEEDLESEADGDYEDEVPEDDLGADLGAGLGAGLGDEVDDLGDEVDDDEVEFEEADEMDYEDEESDEDLELEADHEFSDEEGETDFDEEDDELDLEAVIAELEQELDETDGVDDYGEDNTVVDDLDDGDGGITENDVSSDIGQADNKVNPEAGDSSKTGAQGPEGEGQDEVAGNELDDHTTVDDLNDGDSGITEGEDDIDIDLSELLGLVDEVDDNDPNNSSDKPAPQSELEKVEGLTRKLTASNKKLAEYTKVIKYMRSKLNETTLLSAKLLFTNRIFRAFDLDNASKMKVVENFDRAGTTREVKLVYSTLVESMKGRVTRKVSAPTRKPKTRITEGRKPRGSASKPAGSTRPRKKVKRLTEAQVTRARFQHLANIKPLRA